MLQMMKITKKKKKNCFNLMCKGFVPMERSNLWPGDPIEMVSSYNGYQSYVALKIAQVK